MPEMSRNGETGTSGNVRIYWLLEECIVHDPIDGTKPVDFFVYEFDGQWYELRHSRPKQICGALKKNGERCRSKTLHRCGKCKFHGGLSTGARTPEGMVRAIAAMQAGHKRWRERKR
jgi:hypothetical protein